MAARRLTSPSGTDDRGLYSGLVRLHILHRAAERPIFGQAMIDELADLGYRLSAGTLYPILHGMEQQGYLRSRQTLREGRTRRVYRVTPCGTPGTGCGSTAGAAIVWGDVQQRVSDGAEGC